MPQERETGLDSDWNEKKRIGNKCHDQTDDGVSPDHQPVNSNAEGIYSNEAGMLLIGGEYTVVYDDSAVGVTDLKCHWI